MSTTGSTAPSSSISAAPSTAASTSPATRPPTRTAFAAMCSTSCSDLNLPLVRYPGGNFVSNYDWEDGVGPQGQASGAARLCLADDARPTQVGTDEFVRCGAGRPAPRRCSPSISARAASTRLSPCSNIATTPAAPTGATFAARTAAKDPHDVRVWCLGNEMDGPWQIGPPHRLRIRPRRQRSRPRHEEFRPDARDSSSAALRTPTCRPIPTGRRRCSSECYEVVDHISLHIYFDNYEQGLSRISSPSRW